MLKSKDRLMLMDLTPLSCKKRRSVRLNSRTYHRNNLPLISISCISVGVRAKCPHHTVKPLITRLLYSLSVSFTRVLKLFILLFFVVLGIFPQYVLHAANRHRFLGVFACIVAHSNPPVRWLRIRL